MALDRHLSGSPPQDETSLKLLIGQQAQADWELFFTLSLDLMCIIGFDGYFKRLNPAWEEVLGFNHAELLSQPFIDFVHPADREPTRVELQRHIAGSNTRNFENRYRCKDGSYRWFSWKTLSPAEQSIYVVARDVTLEKQIQAATRSAVAAAELEELSRLKDEFLSTISHELRSPITNIKMAIHLLAIALNQNQTSLEPPPKSSKVARYFQVLQDECDREIRLINDLLDIQPSNVEVQALALETILLESWLRRIVEPFQARAYSRKQTLQLNLPSAMPPLVSERASLERILVELLNNACKYTPPGEQIILQANVRLGKTQIEVMNSGVEIPVEQLDRIFDKFYRIPSIDSWKQGGTGLGLALVKKLTERLGGRVWVESASNQTCFTVELSTHSPTG